MNIRSEHINIPGAPSTPSIRGTINSIKEANKSIEELKISLNNTIDSIELKVHDNFIIYANDSNYYYLYRHILSIDDDFITFLNLAKDFGQNQGVYTSKINSFKIEIKDIINDYLHRDSTMDYTNSAQLDEVLSKAIEISINKKRREE